MDTVTVTAFEGWAVTATTAPLEATVLALAEAPVSLIGVAVACSDAIWVLAAASSVCELPGWWSGRRPGIRTVSGGS